MVHRSRSDDNSIGRITTAGKVSESPVLVSTSPRHNRRCRWSLWFTNEYITSSPRTSIGRITTSGVILSFARGIEGGTNSITAGPGDNLWFTNDYNNSIGRITTAGVFPTSRPAPGTPQKGSRLVPMGTCGSRKSTSSGR